MSFIPVNEPLLNGHEKNTYVNALILDGFLQRDHSLSGLKKKCLRV